MNLLLRSAKGTIFDIATGNLITLDATGAVVRCAPQSWLAPCVTLGWARACHGFKALSPEEIGKTWPDGVWPGIATLRKHTKHGL